MKINSKTFSHFFTLSVGSIFSLVVNILVLIMFSRLFSKEQFGNYAIFVSVVSILSISGTFRLEHLIVLQKTKSEAFFLSSVCKKIINYFSLIVLFISILLFLFSVSFFNQYSFLWLLIPISVYFLSHIIIFLSWNNKVRNYKLISNYKILQSITVGFVGISLGYFYNELGLILSYVTGLLTSFFLFNINFKKFIKKFRFNSFKIKDIIEVFKENKSYIKKSFGLEFFNTIGKYVPNFILNAYYGNAIVGVYDMTLKVLNIPKNIISFNIGELYYQKASVFYHKSSLKFNKLTLETFFTLLVLSIICYLPFIYFGEELFVFVLGSKWDLSGKFSEIYAFWILLLFVTSPMAYIFYIKNTLSKLFLFISISFILKIILLYYFVTTNIETIAIYNYGFLCVFLEMILIYLILKQKIKVNSK